MQGMVEWPAHPYSRPPGCTHLLEGQQLPQQHLKAVGGDGGVLRPHHPLEVAERGVVVADAVRGGKLPQQPLPGPKELQVAGAAALGLQRCRKQLIIHLQGGGQARAAG